MSVRKRGSTWWIDFTTPRGERVRQSARTTDRGAAQELHDKLRADAWRAERIGGLARTWDEAALRYLQHYRNREKARHVRRFTAFFRGQRLDQIGREDIERALAGLAQPYNWNRHLATLRHLLGLARDEWQWTPTVAILRPIPEPRRRVEYLTPSEASALLQALPEQHRALVRFALATGLRLGSILALEWSQVDLGRRVAWIHPEQAKAGRAIPVPLNAEAVEAIRGQPMRNKRVFPRKRIASKVWQRAVVAAGIERRIRFHDLRHTWASWHVQAGTPLYALQEMGGWASHEMVRRYAHLAPEHLAVHAERIATHLRHSPSDSPATAESSKSLITPRLGNRGRGGKMVNITIETKQALDKITAPYHARWEAGDPTDSDWIDEVAAYCGAHNMDFVAAATYLEMPGYR